MKARFRLYIRDGEVRQCKPMNSAAHDHVKAMAIELFEMLGKKIK